MPFDDPEPMKRKSRESDVTAVPIKAGSSTYNRIDYLIMIGWFDLRTELKVKVLFTDGGVAFVDGSKINADSMLIRPRNIREFSETMSWNHLSLVYDSGIGSGNPAFVAGSGGWTVPTYLQGWGVQVEVPRAKVNGRLTVILPYAPDSADGYPTATMQIGCDTSAPFPAPDITFSMYDGVQEGLLAQTKLIVTFAEEWATYVANAPTIVFEADDPARVEFVNKPAAANAKIETRTVSEENLVPDTSDNGDNGDDPSKPDGSGDGGLGAGPIAGIVIGVVAIVAIAGFCVWFFVLRGGGNDAEA
jgi:hypothetical protein